MKADNLPKWIESHPLYQEVTLNKFRKILKSWGNLHFRSFPWRQTRDPYAILMAEIMLHRTQVKQVVPVYNAFIEKYPEINNIHEDSEDNIKKALKPLGLNWRIELVRKMADEIYDRFGSIIPRDKDLLVSLPGINDYIACAVRCFAWNYPESIIDTNTIRIVGRLFEIETKDSSRRNQGVRNLIQTLVDPQEPSRFNYALLDMAHLVCHEKVEPECEICPISYICIYGQKCKKETEK
jgi:A/G-specific adenine glycosylase